MTQAPVTTKQRTAWPSVPVVGLWAGPALAALVLLLPPGAGMTVEAHRLAAVTVLMATWWMTEAAPVAATALLPLALFPLLGIQGARATAAGYGHDLIWLFFGGFQIAFAIERWGLHRRAALAMVRLLGTRSDRLVLGFMAASALLSMWLLNTSTTLMLLPVAMAVARAIEPAAEGDGAGAAEDAEPGPFGAALLLGVAYAVSVGGTGTLVGTAPNGIFAGVAREFGFTVDFADWMVFAAPLALLLSLGIWLYLTRVAFPVPRSRLPDDHPAARALREPLGPWSVGERRTAVVFGLAAAAWVLRRPLKLGGAGVTDATVAIAATIALFLIPAPSRPRDAEAASTPAGGTRLLTWDVSARTPWHILILFGGGFALASGFESTGLSAWLGGRLADAVGGLPLVVVVLAATLFVTFLTEVTSNTATATVLLPVIGGLAQAMDLAAPLLMVPAALAASCAFMLPVATPPNAIVYASGLFRLRDMARVGLWINLGTAAAITAWCLTWGRWTLL